jgi:RNA polymerase sigma-70 factor (ECF subfamily)
MGKNALPTDEMAESSGEFESMYEVNQPLIYRFMFWRTKDEMLSQDLTSTVFEKAWRTRNGFTGGSAKAWLFRIANTTLIDYWRKVKDIADDGTLFSRIENNDVPLDQALDTILRIEDLRQAVHTLPDDMRHVVQLRFIEGKSARDTALKLELSESNVRVLQFRALKKLKKLLQ